MNQIISIPSSLPSQAGQAGNYLTTDGNQASWGAVNSLPSQGGNAGLFLTTNGTTASWAAASGSFNPSTTLQIVEDFCTGDYNAGSGCIASENVWKTIQSGSPSFTCHGSTIPSSNLHPGVLQIAVSAATTDIGSISSGSFNNNPNSFVAVGNGQCQLDLVFNINALSNGTNNAQFIFGFVDSPPGSVPGNGIYFYYEIGSSANWQCFTTASGTATTTVSSSAVAQGWNHGTIIVDPTGANVFFYMNGTLIATNTTNIPTAGIPFLAGYRKTLGSSAMQVGIDYISIFKTFTTAR